MARRSHGFAVIDGGRSVRRRPRRRAWRLRHAPSLALVAVAGILLAIAPLDGLIIRPPEPGEGSTPRCRILSVIDGDTLRIHCPARGVERARLLGYDTPELFSPRCLAEYRAARGAKQALSRMIRSADRAAIVREGEDRYGRALVSLYLDDVSVSRTMIDAGHARPYNGGSRDGWCA